MAQFYLHLHETDMVVADEEGCDVADVHEARSLAVSAARDIMSFEVQAGQLCLECCIVIEDERHQEVGRLPFRDALAITGL